MHLLSEANLWACDPGHLKAFLATVAGCMHLHAHIDVSTPGGGASGNDSTPAIDIDDEGIAHITVAGVMLPKADASYDWLGIEYAATDRIAAQVRAAHADPAVQGIHLHIDSPGGAVVGTQALAATVRAAAADIPVTALVDACCASAAYWVAAQAGSIIASPTATIGSIGVYSAMVDSSQAAAAAGYQVHLIASGPLKGQGAVDGAPISAEAIAERQARAEAMAAIFIDEIVTGRGLAASAVAALATGGAWLGRQAAELGLIDTVSITPAGAPPAQPRKEHAMQTEILGLIKAHPEAAALIAEQVEQGASIEAISAAITTQGFQARIAELEGINADLEQALTEKITGLEATVTELESARDALQGDLDQAKAQLAEIGALQPDHGDPGPGDADSQLTVTEAQYEAMTIKERAAFHTAGGIIAA